MGFKEIPSASEQDVARDFLMSLLGDLDMAGMTETETAAQGVLAGLLRGDAFEDPYESQYWHGLREQSRIGEEEAISALRHRQSASGMYRSGKAGRMEMETRRRFGADRSALLGSLYERERDRDNPYTRLAAVQAYGSLPRDIENAKLFARYGLQAPIAGTILNEPRYLFEHSATQTPTFTKALMALESLGVFIGGVKGNNNSTTNNQQSNSGYRHQYATEEENWDR